MRVCLAILRNLYEAMRNYNLSFHSVVALSDDAGFSNANLINLSNWRRLSSNPGYMLCGDFPQHPRLGAIIRPRVMLEIVLIL